MRVVSEREFDSHPLNQLAHRAFASGLTKCAAAKTGSSDVRGKSERLAVG